MVAFGELIDVIALGEADEIGDGPRVLATMMKAGWRGESVAQPRQRLAHPERSSSAGVFTAPAQSTIIFASIR